MTLIQPTLRLFACGGTFDKRYDPLKGELAFTTSQLEAIVARARLTVPVVVETLMQVDSLDMQPADRERILAACRSASEKSLVVVHGTDTMADTAAVLGPHFGDESGDDSGDERARASGKTVVLTGAMVPYAISQSDALFNLGFACACAQALAPGVWIAMNGRWHAWHDVRKNREAGVFEAVDRGAGPGLT
jgi:L-asparaginase